LTRTVIIGALMLLLGGCSALRLAYNQAPDWTYWWLDGYVDFTDEQSPRVREAVATWFKWHRSTQLTDYAALLAQLRSQIGEPMTPAQACRWTDELTERVDHAVEQAIPALVDSVRSLTPRQLRHLERKFAKNNETYVADYLQPSADERMKAQVKRVLDRAEFFYGSLDEAQRQRLVQGVAESPFDAPRWLAERQLRQQDIVQTLRRVSTQPVGDADARSALTALYEHSVVSPREPYRAYQQRLKEYNCMWIAQMHQLTTPEQRRHAAKQLRGWEDDLRRLAADSAR